MPLMLLALSPLPTWALLLLLLLPQVMEAREEVEAEDNQEQLVKLHSANKQRAAGVCQELSKAFVAGDLDAARQLTAQLSYWVRLEEAIAAKL
jgi:molecular chaperone HscB